MTDLINLPSPRPPLPTFLQAGFSHEIACAASKLYDQRAKEFKRRMEATLTVTWQKMATLPDPLVLSGSPMGEDISTLTRAYLRCLEEWKEETIQLLRQASKIQPRAAPLRSSRSFHHEHLPLLERFFEGNPFPTYADKVFLAKKSNMEYRQIHVWFQNRRNRSKRKIKSSRKKLSFEDTAKPLHGFYERMKDYVVGPIPLTQSSKTSLGEIDGEVRIAPNCAFTSLPPLHAFPSSYPPTCIYDPFPCTTGPISFEKPEWRRLPCSDPPPFVSISIDGLVETFSQLNVRCDTRQKGYHRLGSHAATAAITVVPSCAPHPSLVVDKNAQPVHSALHPLVHVFRSPGPNSKPVTLPLLSGPPHRSECSTKRRTAPLPQRFPGRMQNNKRGATPSERSSTSLSSLMFSAGWKSRKCPLSSLGSSPSSISTSYIPKLPHSPSCLPSERPLISVT